ncbi:MAG: esterase-like activity of phytase family protein [Pseudomonadota bacterium]
MKAIAGVLLALALAACSEAVSQQPPPAPIDPDHWRDVNVVARPVELGGDRVGDLSFRGGLELTSRDFAFGGLSGLVVGDDLSVVAITDNGDWFQGKLTLDDVGRLVGVADGQMALMRGTNGKPFESKEAGDSEDITRLPDGRYAVSFEQIQKVRIYNLPRDGPFGHAEWGPELARARTLPNNEGLEALTTDADGALLVGAEHGDRRGHMIWRAPLDAAAPVQPVARLRMGVGFGLAGFARLPDGDIIALERFYAPVVGVRIRLERLDGAALRQGRVAAREIAYFQPPLAIDNFEGVSAVRRADGGTRLYLISDNNFSARQRTLLYAFDLDENPQR